MSGAVDSKALVWSSSMPLSLVWTPHIACSFRGSAAGFVAHAHTVRAAPPSTLPVSYLYSWQPQSFHHRRGTLHHSLFSRAGAALQQRLIRHPCSVSAAHSAIAMSGLAGPVFFLDAFAGRQWDDPSYSGTRVSFDKAEFVARIHELHSQV